MIARKNYHEELKRDAVALYPDTEGATITQVAAELGVRPDCRRGAKPRARRCGTRKHASVTGPAPEADTAEQELARLRAEVSELRADKTRLSTERDILRSVAKFFAGETNW